MIWPRTTPSTFNDQSALTQRLHLTHKAMLLTKLAYTNLRRVQESYKVNYDRRVNFEAMFAPSDFVSIEWPSLSSSPAQRLVAEAYKMLLSGILSAYRVSRLAPIYAMIWYRRMRKIVAIDRMIAAPCAAKEENKNVAERT